jgi:3-oxoacyl-[acyl-carrier protein] reductase
MVMSRLRSFSQRRDSRVKVAVITGGSRGIGREIAVDFARAGAQTVIVSSVTNLAAASKIITTAGGPTPLAIAADLRTLEGCQQVFNNVKEKFNRCEQCHTDNTERRDDIRKKSKESSPEET